MPEDIPHYHDDGAFELPPDRKARLEAAIARGRTGRKRTPAEVDAEVERRERQYAAGVEAQWNLSDVLDSIRDGVLVASGYRQHASGHPLAQRYADPRAPITLHKIVEDLSASRGVPVSRHDPQQLVMAALGTSDLPDVVASVANTISQSRQSRGLADLLAVTSPIELPNFESAAFVTAQIENMPVPVYGTSAEARTLPSLNIGTAGVEVAVASAASLLEISRQVVINGDLRAVTSGIESFISAAFRVEWEMFSSLLTNNALLADGVPWFDATAGNLLTATSLDSGGMSAARSALRSAPAENGKPADAKARSLVVPSDLEQTALELVQLLPSNEQLRVVATAGLPAGTWFLLSDPRENPSVGRCTIAGPNGVSVTFENGADRLSSDATAVRSRHDVGFAPLSRTGIVRADI